MRPLIVLGSGGFAFTMLDAMIDADLEGFKLAGFAQNEDPKRRGETIEGYPVYSLEELPSLAATHDAICMLGDCGAKRRFVESVEPMGFQFATLINPHTRVSRFATFGPGSYVGFGSIVASHNRLGRHCSIMSQSLVGENCELGDYVFVASGTQIGGSTRIGAEAYIGMGSVIRERITIGSRAVVGAGAVVVHDVPDGVTVAGNPAREIEARSSVFRGKP